MEVKVVFFFVILAFVSVTCFPRDSSVAKTQDVFKIDAENTKTEKAVEGFHSEGEILSEDSELSRPRISGYSRVGCPHVEATEDPICQEHCLPKGYSFGICVSNTCSCV